MTTLQVSYDPSAKVVTVQQEGDTVPEGSTPIGTFEHPDPVYPGSVVIFHGVRDLLYKRKPDGTPGFWPNNITDLQFIQIVLDNVIELVELELVPVTLELVQGTTGQFTAVKTPENAVGTVVWSTDNPEVATVDAGGEVTAVSVGIANITAAVGSITTSAEVSVVA